MWDTDSHQDQLAYSKKLEMWGEPQQAGKTWFDSNGKKHYMEATSWMASIQYSSLTQLLKSYLLDSISKRHFLVTAVTWALIFSFMHIRDCFLYWKGVTKWRQNSSGPPLPLFFMAFGRTPSFLLPFLICNASNSFQIWHTLPASTWSHLGWKALTCFKWNFMKSFPLLYCQDLFLNGLSRDCSSLCQLLMI